MRFLSLLFLFSCAPASSPLEAHRARVTCAFSCGTFATMRQGGAFRDCDADKCIAICDGKEPPKCPAREE